MDRRDFLERLIAAGGVAALAGAAADDLLALGRAGHAQAAGQGARVLDAHAMATVVAAAERIIPRTDTPGATDAKVGAFVDHMLDGWYAPAERARFVDGLAALDARSRELAGAEFTALDVAAQERVLLTFDGEVQALRRTDASAASAHWFAMCKYLTVWGFCTSLEGMRDVLHTYPPPMRYDGNAAVAP